ncbi:unnamed protein product [Calypogeia fissa]
MNQSNTTTRYAGRRLDDRCRLRRRTSREEQCSSSSSGVSTQSNATKPNQSARPDVTEINIWRPDNGVGRQARRQCALVVHFSATLLYSAQSVAVSARLVSTRRKAESFVLSLCLTDEFRRQAAGGSKCEMNRTGHRGGRNSRKEGSLQEYEQAQASVDSATLHCRKQMSWAPRSKSSSLLGSASSSRLPFSLASREGQPRLSLSLSLCQSWCLVCSIRSSPLLHSAAIGVGAWLAFQVLEEGKPRCSGG